MSIVAGLWEESDGWKPKGRLPGLPRLQYNSKLSLSFDHGEAPACAEHQTLQPSKDQRLDFINQSTQRNDLEVFKFDPAARSFGNGVARIVHVGLFEDMERRWPGSSEGSVS